MDAAPTILAIDPSRDDADMLRFALVDGGVDARGFAWVADLDAARAAVGERRPEALLCRLRLAGQSIAQQVAAVRALCHDCPVVFYTEDDDQDGVLHALRAGASDCLTRGEVPMRLAWALRTAAERETHRSQHLRAAAQDRRTESLGAIGRLAQGTALEVNNALAVAGSALGELSAATGGLPRELLDRVALADAALDRVRAAMETLVAVGQSAPLKAENIHLQTFLDGVMPMVSREAGAGVNIDRWLLPGLPPVRFDRAALTQIFVHLGALAGAAMPEGGDLMIRGRLDPAGQAIVLTASDTGAAPTAAQVRAAHQPFTPLHGDSGPGLARIHGLLAQSGGALNVELPREGGTRMVLRLPVGTETARAAADPREVPRAGGETVLVVEDEPALRRLLGSALREAGFEVLAAADARTAVRTARSAPQLDLVLSDMILPGGRVDSLVHILREAHPGVPIVFMTGQIEYPALPSAARGAPVLRKPFRLSTLLRTVQDQLKR